MPQTGSTNEPRAAGTGWAWCSAMSSARIEIAISSGGRAQPRDGACYGRRPSDHQPRRRKLWLEEDLERAAAQAGIVFDDGVLEHARSVHLRAAVAGNDAEQHRFAGLERAQRVETDG